MSKRILPPRTDQGARDSAWRGPSKGDDESVAWNTSDRPNAYQTRRCPACGDTLPESKRWGTVYCSKRCQQRLAMQRYRQRRGAKKTGGTAAPSKSSYGAAFGVQKKEETDAS